MQAVQEAMQSGYVAPAGPQLTAFEEAFAAKLGVPGALALASGTAALHLALHLALQLAGVRAGDTVLCSTLTFVASANPIRYLGATPYFIDSERQSWNLDANLLAETLAEFRHKGTLPKALVLVHVLGQAADIEPIQALCREYGVTLIEDAAEALGATYKERSPGTFGDFAIFSFNGNKMVTTSGGGMLLASEAHLQKARYLSTQAREPGLDYEHREVGYNYRLSNINAAIGLAQLKRLEDKVTRRREIFSHYEENLKCLPLQFMPEAPWGQHSRWLTCLTFATQSQRDAVLEALTAANIEARPVWRPMHRQPIFETCGCAGGAVAEELWQRGLCLPSGDGLTESQQQRVIETVLKAGSTF